MNPSLEYYFKQIAEELDKLPLDREPAGLYQPVSYCLENGGKRIRPLMTILGCEIMGGDTSLAMPPAIGLELFHNFTLMHDDIMDDAPVRRNKPTIHKKWNINTAILSGDALFALACSYVCRVPDNALRSVSGLFHQTVMEVCEGQQYDMDFEKRDNVSVEEYLNMIRLKTAVLPAACLKTGAILAGVQEVEQQKLYRFGEHIGIAFQLRDDWLDVYGDTREFGKQTGGDIIANKKTWLYIQALNIANRVQKDTLREAFKNSPQSDQKNQSKVKAVREIYDQLGISELAQEEMKKHYAKAFDYLDIVCQPESRKENLKVLAKSLFDRKK